MPQTDPNETDGVIDQPFTIEEMDGIKDFLNDTNTDPHSPPLYMFVGSTTRDPQVNLSFPGQSGLRWNGDDPPGLDRDDSDWVAVFANGVIRPLNGTYQGSPDERLRAAARKTAVHEIGHVLNIGENEPDERINGSEVYSGSGSDPTIERVEDGSGTDVQLWSVMSRGQTPFQYIRPMNGTYFGFSIEELLTVSTEDTQVESGP